MSIFRTKDIEQIRQQAAASGLKKTLTSFDLMLLGIGAIIGVGIFVATGVAAAKYAGPAISVSYALAAVVCIFTALAYGELASMVPVAGSSYTYSYIVFGELIAWMVGWGVLMVFTIGGSTVSAGWSGYVTGILADSGYPLPQMLTTIPADGGLVNLPAAMIPLALALFLVRGTEETAKLNNILVAVKVGTIALFLFVAAKYINFDHWADFTPFGYKGVAIGAATIIFAYAGFEAVANAAEECKNPRRDLPIGIIGSLIIAAVCYISVSAGLTAIAPYNLLHSAEPMAVALRYNADKMGSALVAIGAFAGMTTVLLMQIFAQSRLLFAMSRDGMVPRIFKRLHKRFDTPYYAILLSGGLMSVISGFAPVETITKMTSMFLMTTFVAVSIGVLIMRVTKPNLARTFKCPAVWVVAPISLLSSAYLLFELITDLYVPYLICMSVGLSIYILYGYRHSILNDNVVVDEEEAVNIPI